MMIHRTIPYRGKAPHLHGQTHPRLDNLPLPTDLTAMFVSGWSTIYDKI